jgi:hypothetical protein
MKLLIPLLLLLIFFAIWFVYIAYPVKQPRTAALVINRQYLPARDIPGYKSVPEPRFGFHWSMGKLQMGPYTTYKQVPCIYHYPEEFYLTIEFFSTDNPKRQETFSVNKEYYENHDVNSEIVVREWWSDILGYQGYERE